MIRRTAAYLAVAVGAALSAVSPAGADAPPYSPGSTTLDFGNVALNTTQTKSVDVTLASGYLIGLPVAETSGGSAGSAAGSNFTADATECDVLVDGGTCAVAFTFTPDAVYNDYYADYRLPVCPVSWGLANCSDSLNDGYIDVLVIGDGVSAFTADPTSLDTGDVPLNTAVTRDVTFTVDAGYFFGGANYGGTGADLGFDFGSCGGFAGPGTCTAHVKITPTALGAVTGYLNGEECPGSGGANCNSVTPGYQSAHVDLSGTGLSMLAASPAGADFGDVPLNTPVTKEVDVTLDTGYYFGGDLGVSGQGFTAGSCGFVVGPATCRLTFTFEPGHLGPSSGTATLVECPNSGCGANSSPLDLAIPLSGNGVSVLGASPANLDFADVAVGTTATKTVTVTLDRGYYLAGAGGGNPSFGVGPQSCSGTTCNVDVTFTPTAIGPTSDTIAFHECAVGDAVCAAGPLLGFTTTVSAEGAGVNPVADLAVAVSAPSPVRNKQPVTLTVTVTNHGPDAATFVTLTNTLPTASAFVGDTTAQGSCSAPPVGSTGTMVCSLGSLASGATTTINVTITPTVKNNNLIQDTATVAQNAVDIDPAPADDSATVTIQVK